MEELEYRYEYDKVFDAIISAVKSCGLKIESADKNLGKIKSSTGFSLLSWGEDIEIKLIRLSPKKTKVEISSFPKAQLFDWGKSAKNKERIRNKIKDILG
ncbi:MAG: hypothetical protein U9N41_07990 [Euryarchaeota archaeon]|nr:hypothetical protein [Euryarchaeota archaeon]